MAVITPTMTTIKKIEAEHAKVEDRKGLYKHLAEVFKIKYLSVRNNWFLKDAFSIPEAEQENVLAEIKKYRKTEK